MPGDEPRKAKEGKDVITLDPRLTNRGWCVKCDGVTARRDAKGEWRHGWCEDGAGGINKYLTAVARGGGKE